MHLATNEVNEQVQITKDDGVVLLIAEDDNMYFVLMAKVLGRLGVSNKIVRFVNGQEVLTFLQSQVNRNNESGPEYLLILDINMPKLNGIEVLKVIKQSEKLRNITVVMNSLTDDPETIEQCYSLGCADYVVKTGNSENIRQLFSHIGLSLSKA